jgi:hypothetical protein
MLQTEYDFTLPRGYIDSAGNLHHRGVMRLATALDEVEPLADHRSHENEAYLGILLLSRVVIRLGDISPLTPAIVEHLFASDFAYLQELYLQLNNVSGNLAETECPNCGKRFAVELRAEGVDGQS